MAFLDNSGDIILDAVLTDTGRFRLSKGDGSFKIAKFAFGDDEINYGNYNSQNTSGSAYYDLDILTTPVLEAFTNNTSTMKTQLISVPRTDLLYLPILKINTVMGGNSNTSQTAMVQNSSSFFVLADTASANPSSATTPWNGVAGVLDGTLTLNNSSYVRIDQGLDTTEIPYSFNIDQMLKETQYIVQIDSRLGQLASEAGSSTNKQPSFIDDDNMAFYYLSINTDQNYVGNIDDTANAANSSAATTNIQGPRGTFLKFKIKASTELSVSNYLFSRLGGTFTFYGASGRYIDTFIRITGATTGYSLDVPVRFIKAT
jgi:hypothetical protein